MAFLGHHLLPNRLDATTAVVEQTREFTSEFLVQEDCVLANKAIREVSPKYFKSEYLVEIERGSVILDSPGGNEMILQGDRLIFAGDIGAFYAGTYLGRNKLCPSVSPKKTIEGALGGIAANLLVGGLFFLFVLPPLPWGFGLVALVAMGAAGQVGDLFESVLKRAAGVKDSGAILPGHRGILDRIDALLFAAPLAYAFKAVFV